MSKRRALGDDAAPPTGAAKWMPWVLLALLVDATTGRGFWSKRR